jgi:hypothetical protein
MEILPINPIVRGSPAMGVLATRTVLSKSDISYVDVCVMAHVIQHAPDVFSRLITDSSLCIPFLSDIKRMGRELTLNYSINENNMNSFDFDFKERVVGIYADNCMSSVIDVCLEFKKRLACSEDLSRCLQDPSVGTEMCLICMDDDTSTSSRCSRCRAEFHQKCLVGYFLRDNVSCPQCRTDLYTKDTLEKIRHSKRDIELVVKALL